jgi:hypothetical protein
MLSSMFVKTSHHLFLVVHLVVALLIRAIRTNQHLSLGAHLVALQILHLGEARLVGVLTQTNCLPSSVAMEQHMSNMVVQH